MTKSDKTKRELDYVKGKLAEDLAAWHLQQCGWDVRRSGFENMFPNKIGALEGEYASKLINSKLLRRVRLMPDLLVFHNDELMFVEVKYRAKLFLSNDHTRCKDCDHLQRMHLYSNSDKLCGKSKKCDFYPCLQCRYRDFIFKGPGLIFYLVGGECTLDATPSSKNAREPFSKKLTIATFHTAAPGWWYGDAAKAAVTDGPKSVRTPRFRDVFIKYVAPLLKHLDFENTDCFEIQQAAFELTVAGERAKKWLKET